MSIRRINNPLDLTELEFKEVSHKKLRKFQELTKKHNHITMKSLTSAALEDKLFTQNASLDRMILWLWMNSLKNVLTQRVNICFIQ